MCVYAFIWLQFSRLLLFCCLVFSVFFLDDVLFCFLGFVFLLYWVFVRSFFEKELKNWADREEERI